MDKSEKPQRGVFYKSQMQGKAYVDSRVFSREQKKIFEKSWIFVGSVSQLLKEKDYILMNLFDWSLIIGRYGGEIRAFENRCPHRSSPIHGCDSGNRDLKCPFHGWSFKSDGAVHGIPQQQEIFGFTPEEKKELRLQPFPVETVGDLIFVKMPRCRRSLKEFLGNAREALLSFNSQWTTRNPWEVNDIKANWKIFIEIALEAYHTYEVHSTSLGAQEVASTSYYNFSSAKNGHQILNIGNHPSSSMTLRAATIIFIFPNSFLIQIDGELSSVLQVLPLKEDRTMLRSYTYFRRDAKPGLAPFRALGKSLRHTNMEDQKICEGIQKRIQNHKRGQPLAAIEKAVYQFQKDYLGWMSCNPFRF